MAIADDVILASDVRIPHPELINLYGCEIATGSFVGPFVEVQRGVRVGQNCKVESHSFICSGVVLEDGVMVAHGVMFTNDRFPRATGCEGRPKGARDWRLEPTLVCRGASIGSNAVILCGITIGAGALVGAGAVVVRDVPANAIVAGNPAGVIGDVRERLRVEAVA